MDVSIIIPCCNAEKYLGECLQSVLSQNLGELRVEVSFFDDVSTDRSFVVAQDYKNRLLQRNIGLILTRSESRGAGGVGLAKNAAVRASSGRFLCFLDADDFSDSERVKLQYDAALKLPDLAIIGAKFDRLPTDSTLRYTSWANRLNDSQLFTQIFTSNGPTLVAPTWFLSRHLFDSVGGFDESKERGYPEDLDFFYKALRLGASLYRVDRTLVTYRYHSECASFGVSEDTIFRIRVSEFEARILADVQKNPKWQNFTIWNAGKAGKKFFNFLALENRKKVTNFCDVDAKKIRRGFYEPYDDNYVAQRKSKKNSDSKNMPKVGVLKIPIICHRDAHPPVVICVKMDLTGGDLERCIEEKNWSEGDDYYFLC